MALLVRATGGVCFLYNNCYSKVILNSSKFKLPKRHSLKILGHNKHFCSVRFSHTEKFVLETETRYVRYDEFLAERRLQAQRSILLEVQSEKSCEDVFTHCSQFGRIEKMYHYNLSKRHFVLIEFESRANIDAVFSASTHLNHEQIVPVQSNMLWFRNSINRSEKKLGDNVGDIPLTKDACKILNNSEVYNILSTATSVSEQIRLLHDATKLNDAGVRLRFFVAYQIEHSFYGLFPHMAVLPFGSSVNGFGKQGCDLDLSLIFESRKEESKDSRLIFQTKSILIHERYQLKRLLETVGDVMNIFIPSIINVRKILEARVPIIKFDHALTGVECDLTISNMSGYYMSELLYMYGEIDYRVRPLIFTVRKWAQSLKLTTKNVPGPWITNFSLSLLVLFFLQQKKILPSLNYLRSQAAKDDVRIADNCIDCTFQRDITKLSKLSKNLNTENLEKLLLEFFMYYGNFDFDTRAISLREGKVIPKPEHGALFICNPLETTLNVSKNVKYEELERLRVAMRSASWLLEIEEGKKTEKWGLINLFIDNYMNVAKPAQNQKETQNLSNKINVESFFNNDESETNSARKRFNEKKRQKKWKTKSL